MTTLLDRLLAAADDVTESFLDDISALANAVRHGSEEDIARERENALAAVSNLGKIVDRVVSLADDRSEDPRVTIDLEFAEPRGDIPNHPTGRRVRPVARCTCGWVHRGAWYASSGTGLNRSHLAAHDRAMRHLETHAADERASSDPFDGLTDREEET